VYDSILNNKCSAVAEMGDRLAAIDMGRKERAAVLLSGGVAGSLSNTMWPGPRPTCMPSFILIHPTNWPQYTNVIDRTDRTTVRHHRANRFTNGRPKSAHDTIQNKRYTIIARIKLHKNTILRYIHVNYMYHRKEDRLVLA